MDIIYEGEVRLFDPKKRWVKMVATLKRSDGGLSISFNKVSALVTLHKQVYFAECKPPEEFLRKHVSRLGSLIFSLTMLSPTLLKRM